MRSQQRGQAIGDHVGPQAKKRTSLRMDRTEAALSSDASRILAAGALCIEGT
jgi:hypothetical protein